MNTSDGRRLLTLQDAMKVVHVTRRTLYNWMADGKIEVVRTAGGGVRVYEDSLFKRLPATPPAKQPGPAAPIAGNTIYANPGEETTVFKTRGQ